MGGIGRVRSKFRILARFSVSATDCEIFAKCMCVCVGQAKGSPNTKLDCVVEGQQKEGNICVSEREYLLSRIRWDNRNQPTAYLTITEYICKYTSIPNKYTHELASVSGCRVRLSILVCTADSVYTQTHWLYQLVHMVWLRSKWS